MKTTRKPQQFANYKGDRRESIGQIMGPNQMGERLTVVTADYDAKADRTRLGFAYTTTHDVEAAA